MTMHATIDVDGITVPAYDEIRNELVAAFQDIYGPDIYIDPDAQDGQLLSVFAQAIYDMNQVALGVYNQFNPKTSQGVGLSQIVKINGLRRLVASNSSVELRIVGQAGTLIQNGVVGDNLSLNTKWFLPSLVTIPVNGEISVTAQCEFQGAIAAAPGSITEILTPTLGWQTVENLEAAILGAPVETDVELRERQSISTGLPAMSTMDAIVAAVANLPGVQRIKGYENNTSAPDANGLPPHSISLVVLGGDSMQIAETIALNKTPGTGTYGDVTHVVVNAAGIPNTISFFYLDVIDVDVRVDIQALAGYVAPTADKIKAAVAEHITQLDIGETVFLSRLYAPANLAGDAASDILLMDQEALEVFSKTYVVTTIMQDRHGFTPRVANLPMSFKEGAHCVTDNVTVNVSA